MAPEWSLWPLVVIATAATVIASQAVISGVFSVTTQAVSLGLFPRLRVEHSSAENAGQIYVPDDELDTDGGGAWRWSSDSAAPPPWREPTAWPCPAR